MLAPITLTTTILTILLPHPSHAQSYRPPSHTPSRGINCLGSSQCSFTTNNSPNILQAFNLTASLPNPRTNLSAENAFVVNHDPAFENPSNIPPPPPLPGGPIPPLTLFQEGEHILCAKNHVFTGSICLFLQGPHVPATGVPGFIIKERISDLLAHGCKFCGSVPVLGNNRPEDAGILTSNYVWGKACEGVCEREGRKEVRRGGVWVVMVEEEGGGQREVRFDVPG